MKFNLFASLGILLSLSLSTMGFAAESFDSLDLSDFMSTTGSYGQYQGQGEYNQNQGQGQCSQDQSQGQYGQYQGNGQYGQYQTQEQNEQPLARGKARCYAQNTDGSMYSETGSRFRIRHLQRHAIRQCQSSGLNCKLFGCRIN